jgi:hypothetical protein
VLTRTRNALVVAAALTALGAGLGLLAKGRPQVDARARALDAVPNGALLVASADLDALRASPVGAPFLREGREIPGLGKVRDVCGFDPMDTLSEVAISIPAAGDSGDFGLAASGKIDDEALLACAAKVIEARGGKAVVTPVGGFRVVRDAAGAGSGEIAVKKGGPLLLGGGAYLRAMIDTADGRAPSIRRSVAHSLLGKAIGEGAVRVTVVLTPEQRQALVDELESGGAAGSPAASVSAGALGVQLGPVVALHGVIACDDPGACARFAVSIKAARDARAADFGTRLVGIGAVLEQLQIEPQGDMIQLRVAVPAEQAATLLDRVLKLRGLRHPMPSADGSSEPAAPGSAPPALPDASARAGAADAGAPEGEMIPAERAKKDGDAGRR